MHYINRALIFPYRIRTNGKTLPVLMVIMPMLFYIINGYLVGYYFGALVEYPLSWLWDPRFLAGIALFLFGFTVNIQSDNILINLRRPGETGYKIPQGGFFKYVSCPNYFGECMEWLGFALMSWNVMGSIYAIWVIAPLVAQAIEAHRWYREHFQSQYPAERKAIIPFIF
jgi:steroid 5-alpha reductase family enzyme